MKIHSERAELFHTSGRIDRHTHTHTHTHMTKPIVAFRNFVMCLKVEQLIRHHTFCALSETITITSLAHTHTHTHTAKCHIAKTGVEIVPLSPLISHNIFICL